MTEILFEYNHILMRSEYRTPDLHKHLAAHLILGLEGRICCNIEGKSFEAEGVCIASDVEHTVYTDNGEVLLFLFDTTSQYAKELEGLYLCGATFRGIDSDLAGKMRQIWKRNQSNLKVADEEILDLCSIRRHHFHGKDERIAEVLEVLKSLDTVPKNIMDMLCGKVCLSKSRLSHLFKEWIGISLHRYLALDKMRKGYIHYMQSGNITDAAIKAGFDSPSHFAATCKRMFGISFSELQKSMQ